MYNSIRGQRHAKLATIYIAQKAFQKSGNNQCKYEKVDGLMESGSDTSVIGGYEWVIEISTKRKVTVVVYDCDRVKEIIPIGTGWNSIDLPDEKTIIVRANEATILGKYANTSFSETLMDHNDTNIKSTENGLR